MKNIIHKRWRNGGNGGSLDSDKPACESKYMSIKTWEKIKDAARADIPDLILSLTKQMKGSSVGKSETW